jgi:DNA-binding NarL/FixJ family response regulator
MTTNITYVCPSQNVSASDQRCHQIIQELNMEFTNVETIEELFPLLSDPKFRTDLIVIDIERFYGNPGVDVFDIIHTLSTLIKCTVERTGSGKPVKRETKIIAVADSSTDPALIKETLSYPEIKTVTLRSGPGVSYTELRDSIIRITANDFGLDKKVQSWIKPKKTVRKDTSAAIKLTPRQSQILALVSERGASNKVIARMLDISESTVKLHVSAILKKYGVRNRTQLAIFSKNN